MLENINCVCSSKYRAYDFICFGVGYLKTLSSVTRCLMDSPSICPFPFVAPVMFQVTGWAGGRERWTINTIHSLFFFFKCSFSTSKRNIPADSPSRWTQMLLPVKSHPVSPSRHAGMHCVKLLLLKGGPF